MNETPHDENSIEDLIRKVIEISGEGRPIVIGMKIVIGGGPPDAGPYARGGSAEPDIEVQNIGDRVVLSAELPGLSPDQVQVLFRQDRVFIWAKDPDRQYRASRKVPPATEGTIETRYRHGVLEVSYLPSAAAEEVP